MKPKNIEYRKTYKNSVNVAATVKLHKTTENYKRTFQCYNALISQRFKECFPQNSETKTSQTAKKP